MSFSLKEPLIIHEKRRQNTNCLFKYLNQKIRNHILRPRHRTIHTVNEFREFALFTRIGPKL